MPSPRSPVAVVAAEPGDQAQAQALARRLGIPLACPGAGEFIALLQVAGNKLSLQQSGKRAPGPVAVDFGAPAMRHRRRGGHNELLGKAVGLNKKPTLAVLDATAGLGRDSFVLADLGCQVQLVERDPILAELLAWGLARSMAQADAWLQSVLGRMNLHPGDARDLPAALLASQDVIYLDPMFPARDKSAAVKKEMALFQLLLERPDSDDDAVDLLHWALQQPVARVVVKRPLKAPALALRMPSHAISGKSVRFDVYVLAALAGAG